MTVRDGGWSPSEADDQATETVANARRDRSTEIGAATRVLKVLDELEGALDLKPGTSAEVPGWALCDHRLVSEKRFLFFFPFVRVRCARHHHLDWLKLTPVPDMAFRLIHLPDIPHQREREVDAAVVDTKSYILDKYYDELGIGTSAPLGDYWRAVPGTARRFEYEVEYDDDLGPRVTAVTTSEPGQPRSNGYGEVEGLFTDYACPCCTCRHSIRHVSLLRAWLHAVLANEHQIVLGESAGTQTPARPRAVRVESRGTALAWSSRAARRRRSGWGVRT